MTDHWDGNSNTTGDNAGGPAVDMSVLEQYRDLQDEGDPDIVTELIDTFFTDVPNRLNGIREAVSSKNPTQLEREAHNLKGSSANLGAHALSAISFELEKRGKTSDLDGAEAMVDKLEEEFERVHSFLEKERKPS